MAAADGPASRLARAEAVAAHLVAKHRLVPPVDIKAVARLYADLEVDAIPGDCDGLTLDLNSTSGIRPRIIVRRDRGDARLRFTVAHELGHILMYWHRGQSMACHVRSSQEMPLRRDRREEQEANRFASDVLVPRVWLARLIFMLGHEHPEDLLREVERAKVSAAVACLALIRAMPPGHAFELLDKRGQSEFADFSPGSSALVPALAQASSGTTSGPQFWRREIAYGKRTIVWRRLRHNVCAVQADGPDRALAELIAAYPECRSALEHLISGPLPEALDQAHRDGFVSARFLTSRYRRTVAMSETLTREILEDIRLGSWIESLATTHGSSRP